MSVKSINQSSTSIGSVLMVVFLFLAVLFGVSSVQSANDDKGDSTLATKRQAKARLSSEQAKSDSIECPEYSSPEYPSPDEFVPCEKVPEMITAVKPEYPKSARDAGHTGKVWLKCLIEKDGSVLCVKVGKSSGILELDKAAKDAAWDAEFKPAIQNGKPVRIWVTFPLKFSLEK